jgi:hypothetical protein
MPRDDSTATPTVGQLTLQLAMPEHLQSALQELSDLRLRLSEDALRDLDSRFERLLTQLSLGEFMPARKPHNGWSAEIYLPGIDDILVAARSAAKDNLSGFCHGSPCRG